MSWVVGFTGDQSVSLDAALRGAGMGPPLHRVHCGGTMLLAGGLPETCLLIDSVDRSEGEVQHLVLGLGLMAARGQRATSLMTTGDWAEVLRLENAPLPPAGHFLVLTIRPNGVTVVNDRLGLRTIYMREWKGGLLYSTREDLLCRIVDAYSINLGVLGAQWFTFNRWTSDSLVQGVKTLPPGGIARFKHGRLAVEATPWAPRHGASSADEFLEVLRRHTVLEDVSLGLSGGLDSRALLSVLLGSSVAPATHVFGDSNDPDVRTAQRIAAKVGVEQRHLLQPLPPADATIRLIESHAAEARVIVPASQALKVQPYAELHASGKAIIDGGFGEITRRQFMNRLLIRAPERLLRGNAQDMYSFVTFGRGDVFAPEVAARMRLGALRQIQAALDDVRRAEPATAEGAADLLAIRTRLPWYFGIEQARLDSHVRGFMPFAQPDVLEAALRLPLRLRRRGRLIKQMVRMHQPELARVPLVKGRTMVPFLAPREVVWAMLFVHQRVRPSRAAGFRDTFLNHVRPHVEGLVQSTSFRACEWYAHERVASPVHRYFAGDRALGPQVDWWLALEHWRRSMQD